jgi:hypothetical protein
VNTAYREECEAVRCAQCGWPLDEAKVLSTHHTSEGWVRYRRCPCGSVAIQLVHLDERPGLRADLVTIA